MIDKIAIKLGKINTTQKRLTLLLLGALANLAFAPYEFFPILFLSFPILLLMLRSASGIRQAFWHGWWFGFGHFLAGLYWIPNSLLVEGAERFAWLIPFAAMGIPAVLAIYIGLFALLFFKLRSRWKFEGAAEILVFVNLWLLAEIARAYLFTGFPWNLLGYSLLFNLEVAQIASIGGVFFCSWVAMLFALLPLYFKQKKLMAFSILLAVLSWGYGAYYIDNAELQPSGKTVKLLQPNHKQSLYSDPADKRKRFDDSVALMSDGADADYYIWAEATGVYTLNRQPEAVQEIADALPEGALAFVGSDRSKGNTFADFQIWNSAYVISNNGIEDVYNKQHLVPFGEYVPLSAILPLEKITEGMIDFSSGVGEKLIDLPKLQAIPLICYEIIFPSYAQYEGKKPDFIINITNDSWFADSTGPYQHLAMARMRAIESGLPVLRAAKTGISTVVDSHGKVVVFLGLNQTGVVFSDIPDKIIGDTYFNEYKWLVILFCLLSASIIAIFPKRCKI